MADASAAGESVVHIALGAPCTAAAEIALRIDGVLAPRLIETQATEPVLTYRTKQPKRANPAVVAGLVGAGASIVSVVSTTPSLEDVYAHAVGQDEHAPTSRA